MGESYIHPDIPADITAKRIQKEVQYIPFNDFIVYDIQLISDTKYYDEESSRNFMYLPWDDLKFLCIKYGFKVVDEIARGTFENLIKMNPVFEDPTYKQYNLPKIENNFSEGMVLRPVDNQYYKLSRNNIKHKNPTFKENKSKNKSIKINEPLSEEAEQYIYLLDTYITENRLKNVISHEGTFTQKEFGKLLGLFAKDIFNDFIIDHPQFTHIDKIERSRINKQVNMLSANVIRTNFLNIIDGVF